MDLYRKVRDERFRIETTHPSNKFHEKVLSERKKKLKLKEARLLEGWRIVDSMVQDYAPGRTSKPVEQSLLAPLYMLLEEGI